MVVFVPLPVIMPAMKRTAKTTILTLSGLFLAVGAEALTPDAPKQYQGIVERNVFNIHPPAPVVAPVVDKTTQLPKITLNGITTILGTKMCFLSVPGTKPGAQPETLTLAEGQAQSDVEVKQIDEKAGVVKVVNHGE